MLHPAGESGITVNEEAKTVTLSPQTGVDAFVQQVENDHVVLLKDGQPLAENVSIGTGCVVQLQDENGQVLSEYTVIVPMDISGDGNITTSDARTVLRAAVSLETLTGAYSAAADANGDGHITSADARTILRRAVGLDG